MFDMLHIVYLRLVRVSCFCQYYQIKSQEREKKNQGWKITRTEMKVQTGHMKNVGHYESSEPCRTDLENI